MKKIAIVGCGRISKRHIEAIAACPNTEISIVCDINVERAKRQVKSLVFPGQ